MSSKPKSPDHSGSPPQTFNRWLQHGPKALTKGRLCPRWVEVVHDNTGDWA
jgi:hypothetical protein